MIKLNHAIIGCILPMVVLTMYFSNMMDNTWVENRLLSEKVKHLESLLNVLSGPFKQNPRYPLFLK